MGDLTFGEQVKIILGRKGMTIKELAETIEAQTGKKMSRQNLTQRLGRDNFQEQDMRMIAEILGCPFQLDILAGEIPAVTKKKIRVQEEIAERADEAVVEVQADEAAKSDEKLEDHVSRPAYEEEVDMTIGELYEIHEELKELEETMQAGEPVELIEEQSEERALPLTGEEALEFTLEAEEAEAVEELPEDAELIEIEEDSAADKKEEKKFRTGGIFLRRKKSGEEIPEETKVNAAEITMDDEEFEPVIKHNDVKEDVAVGEVNPYTGREYLTNSVRMHPTRIGYVQVYDRTKHNWTDMTEWAFLGYQERKKALLGKDYEPPIYLD